uniref:Uncharacterized protein n=1 Tax=Panagrolaimus davidi TaxID=227884 RepID=A0A914Q8M7_9BILA
MDENHIEISSDLLTINNQALDTRGTMFPNYYTLLQALNGALLTFKSDGNTQGAGFIAALNTYECVCPEKDIILKCDQQNIIMPLIDSRIYCDNMKCNYNILPNSSCPNAYFYLTIYAVLRKTDYLLLKDNGNLNFTGYVGFTDHIYYSSKANLTFEFVSGISTNPISRDQKQWIIQTVNSTPPNFIKINLTDSMQSYVVWLDSMNKNDAITVCSDDKDLEFFVTNSAFYTIPNYALYDGDDLYSNIGT